MLRFCEVLLRTMPQGYPMEAKSRLRRNAADFLAEKAKEASRNSNAASAERPQHSNFALPPAVARRDLLSVVVQAYETCFGILNQKRARRLIEEAVSVRGEKVVIPRSTLGRNPPSSTRPAQCESSGHPELDGTMITGRRALRRGDHAPLKGGKVRHARATEVI
jgi:hypothetical protein